MPISWQILSPFNGFLAGFMKKVDFFLFDLFLGLMHPSRKEIRSRERKKAREKWEKYGNKERKKEYENMRIKKRKYK